MRIKKGYTLRTVGDEHIIVGGVENVDFSQIVSFNESAAYLWKEIEGEEFTSEKLSGLLMGRYEIDEKTARDDVRSLIGEWLKAGIIEE